MELLTSIDHHLIPSYKSKDLLKSQNTKRPAWRAIWVAPKSSEVASFSQTLFHFIFQNNLENLASSLNTTSNFANKSDENSLPPLSFVPTFEAMKPVQATFLVLAGAALCYGFSQPVIRDTKAEGCVGLKCGDHCSWEDVKIFPGEDLNQPGQCSKLRCSDDFSIYITPCPFDGEWSLWSFRWKWLQLFWYWIVISVSRQPRHRSIRMDRQRRQLALPRMLWNQSRKELQLKLSTIQWFFTRCLRTFAWQQNLRLLIFLDGNKCLKKFLVYKFSWSRTAEPTERLFITFFLSHPELN